MSRNKKGSRAGIHWGIQKKKPFVNSFYIIQLTKDIFRIGKIRSKNDRYPENEKFITARRFDFPKNFNIDDMMIHFKDTFEPYSIDGSRYNYNTTALDEAITWVKKYNEMAWKNIEPGSSTISVIYGKDEAPVEPEPEVEPEVKVEPDKAETITIPKPLWEMYMAELDALRIIAKTASEIIYKG